jgi:hypothetical protein|tara:strand:- start:20 stop:253 length:234 start_codon:yes stop_codon:yes gene_type:complete
MTIAKITETRFYDEYGGKKVALLEEGQEVKIVRSLTHGTTVNYLCKVVNPSETSKNHGVWEGMYVEVNPTLAKIFGD